MNAGGMWGREIGAMAGVAVPLCMRAFLHCDRGNDRFIAKSTGAKSA